MSTDDEVKQILREIRDDQRVSLRRQEEQLEIARQQLERAQTQVAESIGLQKEAMAKTRMISRIALPGVIFCIVLILYLIVKYF